MILAAGRGQRMRPLTDTTPKPLLDVQGKPLMQWPMEALLRGGFNRLVINTAWLGEQIEQRFADWPHRHPGADLAFSHEGQDFGYALETAGPTSNSTPPAWTASGPTTGWRTSGWCRIHLTTRKATSDSAPPDWR
jgi:N-acetyl-alpha-D-muramate 1-phosphate uridylyltransferase